MALSKGNIRWKSIFKSRNETTYTLNIYDRDYVGEITPIVCAGDAIDFEHNNSDMFSYINGRSGYIRIVIENRQMIEDIFPNDYTEKFVELLDSWSRCVFCGFISAESFVSEFTSFPFVQDLTVHSCVSVLDYVSYQPLGHRVTFGEIIKHIFTDIVPLGIAGECFFAYFGDNKSPNMFGINDSAFTTRKGDGFEVYMPDEGYGSKVDDATSCKEVMEVFCKTFGYKLTDEGYNLYFSATDIITQYIHIPIGSLDVMKYIYYGNGTKPADYVTSIQSNLVSISTLDKDLLIDNNNSLELLPPLKYAEMLVNGEREDLINIVHDANFEYIDLLRSSHTAEGLMLSAGDHDSQDYFERDIPSGYKIMYLSCDVTILEGEDFKKSDNFVPFLISVKWNDTIITEGEWQLIMWGPDTKYIRIQVKSENNGKVEISFMRANDSDFDRFDVIPDKVRIENVVLSMYNPEHFKYALKERYKHKGLYNSNSVSLDSVVRTYGDGPLQLSFKNDSGAIEKTTPQVFVGNIPSPLSKSAYFVTCYRQIEWSKTSKKKLQIKVPIDATIYNKISIAQNRIRLTGWQLGTYCITHISHNVVEDIYDLTLEEII